MPAFNGERTIEIALQSLGLQTHKSWEAIVVNDGSTDRTSEIVQSFNDPRIKLVDLPRNRGRAYARQVALDESSGDFVAYLDCDDFYHPQKLERQLTYFHNNPKSVYCGCGFGSLDIDGSLRRVRSKRYIKTRKFKLGDPFPFAPVASMIRSDLAHSGAYSPGLRLAEDIDYFYKILDGKLYGTIPDVLYFYHEYASITKRKIAASYFYELCSASAFFSSHPAFAARRIFLTTIKLLALSTVGIVFPVRKIVDGRGVPPSQWDQELLDEVRDKFGSVDKLYTTDFPN